MLPTDVIHGLQLKDIGEGQASLADGTLITVRHYMVVVEWHGQPKLAVALDGGNVALMGMTMMHGNRLSIDVLPGGVVTIEELP